MLNSLLAIYLIGLGIFLIFLPRWLGKETIKAAQLQAVVDGMMTWKQAERFTGYLLLFFSLIWPVYGLVLLWDRLKGRL